MNLSDIANSLVKAAKGFLPMIVPGAGPIIAMAGKLADAIDEGKSVFNETDQAKLSETVTALRTRVNAHVSSTIDTLRNG